MLPTRLQMALMSVVVVLSPASANMQDILIQPYKRCKKLFPNVAVVNVD